VKKQELEYGVLGLMQCNLRDFVEKAWAEGLRVEEVATKKEALRELMEGTIATIRQVEASGDVLQ
jgi:hypothetical protein